MEQGGRRQAEQAPENGNAYPRTGTANWLPPESVRRYLQIALGLVAGFIIGTMVVQGWLGSRDADRIAREGIGATLDQGSVPLNLFFSETVARLMTLEAVAGDAPGNALRLDPGYRQYDTQGAALSGSPALPAIAEAAAVATDTGYPALSMPFTAGGLWYSAIVKERRDARGQHVGYEGIQFPVSRILDWWSRNRLPSGSSATLLSRDGRIWLRDPFVPTLIGADAAGDPFAGGVDADVKYLSRIVDYDGGGVDAIVGWRSLEAFGLIYAVGIDRAQLPAPPGASTTLPLTIALVVTGGAFLLVTFMGRLSVLPTPAPAPSPAPAPRRAERAPIRETREPAPNNGFTTVADKMPVILFEQRIGADLSIEYRYVSHGLRDILGVEPAQLEARPEIMFEMIHADDNARVRHEHEAAWASGEDIDTVYRVVTGQGQEKWVHNLARASAWTRPGEVSVWDGIVLDVTAQKLVESELRTVRSEAELTSRVKAEFLANVSHELRTPLNAIIGFSEVISGETFGPVGVDKYVEYARDIHESADHLLAVVNDILDLSKIEAGRATLVLEDADAAELVDSCLRLIHGRAADARLQLRRLVEDSLPRLLVDPLKIKQILINLLSNAVKFTRSGGTVTLRASSTPEGGVAFAVSDTGIGIAEKDLSKAIETYGQVEPSDGVRVEGTGLGLPLAKALTELHGGELKIESSAGKGTTVMAILPPSCVAPAKRTKS
jgi:signal transduction histidine kinase